MGYRVKRDIYKLKFESAKYAGLEVRVYAPPMGVVIAMTALAGTDLTNLAAVTPDKLARVSEMFDAFLEALVDWNLEDDNGNPVPATAYGIKSQDSVFIQEIIHEWAAISERVDTPLDRLSPAGKLFPVESIPMEPLSPNRAS